jgi:hypothetical protein
MFDKKIEKHYIQRCSSLASIAAAGAAAGLLSVSHGQSGAQTNSKMNFVLVHGTYGEGYI